MRGKIVKAIAGFYYVYVAESGIYACRARGIFRMEGIKPLVGDDVEIDVTDEKDMEGNVVRILDRRNVTVRPAAANVDQVLILFALTHPKPNFGLIDRFLVMAEAQSVPCLLAVNKIDTARGDELSEIRKIYEKSGFPLYFISARRGDGMEELLSALKGKTTLLAGPSGVGKSSLTNAAAGEERMETGEISKKLARGKNTTRHTELVALGEGTFLCDTPGFSALDAAGVSSGGLGACYAEFEPYYRDCRFQGCVHLSEPDCAVKEALGRGAFSPVRYESYRSIYEELSEAERRKYQ